MDAFTLAAKTHQCISAYQMSAFSEWQNIVLERFIDGTFNPHEFTTAMVASGFSNAGRILCLINNFAPGV